MALWKFLRQEIHLVEEEDDRRVLEPLLLADVPEQRQGFAHTVLRAQIQTVGQVRRRKTCNNATNRRQTPCPSM